MQFKFQSSVPSSKKFPEFLKFLLRNRSGARHLVLQHPRHTTIIVYYFNFLNITKSVYIYLMSFYELKIEKVISIVILINWTYIKDLHRPGGPRAEPKKKEVGHGPGRTWCVMGRAAGIRPVQITVCLKLYNTASINQSSARDPSMLFTHARVKQLQNQSTTISMRQTRMFSDSVEHIFYLHSNLCRKKWTSSHWYV